MKTIYTNKIVQTLLFSAIVVAQPATETYAQSFGPSPIADSAQPASSASNPLTGRWKLYGWPCGNDKSDNEIVINIMQTENLFGATIVSTCSDNSYMAGKRYLTGWIEADGKGVSLQRFIYDTRKSETPIKDSRVDIGSISDTGDVIYFHNITQVNNKYLLVRDG